MTVTIALSSEVEQWVKQELGRGPFKSPAEFITSRLTRDCLEETIAEAFLEPASPMTKDDWAEARRRLEESIASGQ